MPEEASERPPRHTPGLEREKVVKSALELLNEVGFEGLTLRRLASKLGVKASALYWHFENKQDLIDQLATAIIEDEIAQAGPRVFGDDTVWQDMLRGMGHGMRRALSRYRDGALIIAKADMTNSKSFQGRDLMIDSIMKQGLTGKQAMMALFTVGRYTLGCVFEEQADPRSAHYTEEASIERRRKALEAYPAMSKAFNDFAPDEIRNPDYHFNQGLELIIAGIEKQLTVSK